MLSIRNYVLAVAMLAGVPALGQEIAWQTNYSQARQLAAEQRRLILIHFYTDNCEPCRVVEKQVFPDHNVVDAVEKNYIPVKLHEKDNPELVRRYGVNRFPADVIVTHTGLPVHRGITPTNARDYTLQLNNLALQSGIGAGRTAQATATSTLPPREQINAQWKQHADQAANLLAGGAQQTQQTATDAGNQLTQSANQVANQAVGTANQVVDQTWQTANQTATQAAGQAQQAITGATDQAQAQVNGYAQRANSWLGGAGQAVAAAVPGAAEQGVAVNNPYASPPAGSAAPAAQANAGPQNPMQTNRYAPPGAAYNPQQGQVVNNPSVPPSQTWSPAQQPPQQQPPTAPQVQNTNFAAAAPPFNPATAPQMAPQQMMPVSSAPVNGLDGFCPVTLFEGKVWKKGDVRWGAIHRGKTYLFGSEESQKKFLANPDHYAPILSGCDAVQYATTGKMIEGRRDFGVVYRNQVYLFENAATRDAFEKAPGGYVASAQQAMKQGNAVYR